MRKHHRRASAHQNLTPFQSFVESLNGRSISFDTAVQIEPSLKGKFGDTAAISDHIMNLKHGVVDENGFPVTPEPIIKAVAEIFGLTVPKAIWEIPTFYEEQTPKSPPVPPPSPPLSKPPAEIEKSETDLPFTPEEAAIAITRKRNAAGLSQPDLARKIHEMGIIPNKVSGVTTGICQLEKAGRKPNGSLGASLPVVRACFVYFGIPGSKIPLEYIEKEKWNQPAQLAVAALATMPSRMTEQGNCWQVFLNEILEAGRGCGLSTQIVIQKAARVSPCTLARLKKGGDITYPTAKKLLDTVGLSEDHLPEPLKNREAKSTVAKPAKPAKKVKMMKEVSLPAPAAATPALPTPSAPPAAESSMLNEAVVRTIGVALGDLIRLEVGRQISDTKEQCEARIAEINMAHAAEITDLEAKHQAEITAVTQPAAPVKMPESSDSSSPATTNGLELTEELQKVLREKSSIEAAYQKLSSEHTEMKHDLMLAQRELKQLQEENGSRIIKTHDIDVDEIVEKPAAKSKIAFSADTVNDLPELIRRVLRLLNAAEIVLKDHRLLIIRRDNKVINMSEVINTTEKYMRIVEAAVGKCLEHDTYKI